MTLVLAGLLPVSSILHTQINLYGPTWMAISLPSVILNFGFPSCVLFAMATAYFV